MNKKIIVIGSGFSSLAASSYLAQAGNEVILLEKNANAGGRANLYKKDGFKFDMGPTWYWMPDVFESFFSDFGKSTSDYYQLDKLNPAYKVVFNEVDSVTIPDNVNDIYHIFESLEPGSSKYLKRFLESAKYNYNVAIKDLVYRPGNSILELITPETIKRVHQFFSSISTSIRRYIKHPYLIQILEFPVLFLGAKPGDTPAFYNFMNYADFGLGTWHPKGGMYEVVKAMTSLATSLGVQIFTEQNVSSIVVKNGKAVGVEVDGHFINADVVLSGADYHHTEKLLDAKYRQYSEKYWNTKTFAPSSLLFYVGFNKKLKNVDHHTLFFDADFDKHAYHIYDNPSWPEKPLFYASFPSITDDTFAPEGNEAATFLIPLAPGIEDTPQLREKYFEQLITRLEKLTQQKVSDAIVFKKSYCVNDFISDYNSYKGNAYGLANILTQTAFLRPKIKSKKVKDLFFTGQLTVPGPGVPPALISGKIASNEIIKAYSNYRKYETVI